MKNIQIVNRYISCVEYYILNFLKDKVDIRKFYYESYIPLSKLYEDYKKVNNEFYNYSGIKRIQETMIECDYLNYFIKESIGYKKINKESVYLILVNDNFFNQHKVKPLRTDHYIQVTKENKRLKYINSYPLESNYILKEDLNKWFANKVIHYKFLNKDTLDYNSSLSNFKKYLYTNNYFDTINDLLNPNNLKSMSFILKVSRYRLYDLLCYFNENKILKDSSLLSLVLEAAQYYEDIFLKLTMMSLKKGNDIVTIANTIYRINLYEEKIFMKVRKEFL